MAGKSHEDEIRHYKRILESLNDAVYATRPDGTILYVNQQYADMKGVPKAELIGTHIHDWVSPADAARADEILDTVRSGDQSVGVLNYEFQTADGESIPAVLRFSPVTRDPVDAGSDTGTTDDTANADDTNNTANADESAQFAETDAATDAATGDPDAIGRVGVIRDVSEQRRRQRELERQNERLDEFASIVSHDLRNPLNIASGRLALARESCDSEHLAAVKQAHDRMETLIDDMLTLARHGNDIESLEPVNLATLVDEAWHGVERTDQEIRIETTQTVLTDRPRLKQLVENLLRNAIEHGDPADGSILTVTVGAIDAEPPGFYVADDGVGLDDVDTDQLFDTGYSTTTDGTGFGLSIVKQIAEAHEWELRVASSADGGARFECRGVEMAE